MNKWAKHYQLTSVWRIEINSQKLRNVINEWVDKNMALEIVRAMQETLIHLSASLRENMPIKEEIQKVKV